MNTDCVFCRIVAGRIPAAWVYDDDYVLAFLDIAPFNKGHCLIIPKQHYNSLTIIPPEIAGRMMEVAARLGAAVLHTTHADGFNLLLSNGVVAGQIVPHTHLHIIPRFPNDGFMLPTRTVAYFDEDEKTRYADEIRKRMRS